MRCLVTGAAGFVGSSLVGRLRAAGHEVVAIDAWRPYYDLAQKRLNVDIHGDPGVAWYDVDLASHDMGPLLEGVDWVFHQAAQPGVRRSWGEFDIYLRDNVEATQRLLAACAASPSLRRFVYASSSSVYGDAPRFPVRETDVPMPRSPYGVTKLAAEHLTTLYARNFDVPTVSLRYFTVYGPGQRPDMAIHRMIRAAILGEDFPLYGDGSAVRDFTYVDDIVTANVLAAASDIEPGTVLNVSGGGATTVNDLLELVATAVGRVVPVTRQGEQAGDVRRTDGSTAALVAATGWAPEVGIADGIRAQVAWQHGLYAT